MSQRLLVDEAVPLLTLTGPGGVGKTRLALAIGHEMATRFADGVVFVDLAPLGDPSLVLPTVARTLGLAEGSDRPLTDRLISVFQRRHLLLVLDNCEHVLTAVADLLAPLLTACPALQVLATSRAPIRVRGEQELPVEPLQLPPPGILTEAKLADNPAVRLFIERARAVRPRFAANDDILGDVSEICRRLDGLPLAIELAASRLKHLPLPTLVRRLERRLPLLTGGPRDQPARLQTMRDAIAWSYELLLPEEQALFRRLGVFVGGFTLEAAAAMMGAQEMGHGAILDGVASLVDKSLVRTIDDRDAEPRYLMLETVRELGLEQLAARSAVEDARAAHASYFLTLAEQAAPELNGPRQLVWFTRLESEHPNLRAALEWFVLQGDATGLRMAAALWRFWFVRGYPREGRAWLEQMLAVPHAWSPALRDALDGASMLASNQGDHLEAAALADQLLTMARKDDDRKGVACALFLLSFAATYQGDQARALALADEALSRFRVLGDLERVAAGLNRLGIEHHNQGGYARASALYEEAHSLWKELGCTWELGCVTTNLGVVAHAQGDTSRAAARYREALLLLQAVGQTWMNEELLALVAALAAASGNWRQAARLIGATDELLVSVGFAPAPFVRVFYERAAASVRRELGEGAFAAEWEAGQRLTPDQALSEAFAVVSTLVESAAPSRQSPLASGLTPRELEVLRLVAAG
ncbi:MAG: ATP-binding protein, partial [Thermomicrobiales bacterium]